jgi:hypothetical protein
MNPNKPEKKKKSGKGKKGKGKGKGKKKWPIYNLVQIKKFKRSIVRRVLLKLKA